MRLNGLGLFVDMDVDTTTTSSITAVVTAITTLSYLRLCHLFPCPFSFTSLFSAVACACVRVSCLGWLVVLGVGVWLWCWCWCSVGGEDEDER